MPRCCNSCFNSDALSLEHSSISSFTRSSRDLLWLAVVVLDGEVDDDDDHDADDGDGSVLVVVVVGVVVVVDDDDEEEEDEDEEEEDDGDDLGCNPCARAFCNARIKSDFSRKLLVDIP